MSFKGSLLLHTLKLKRFEGLLRILFSGALLGVLVLSLLPVEHPEFASNDKINHLLAYAALTMMGLLASFSERRVIVGVFFWGILIEFLQGLTAYRFFSAADMLANGAGVLLGAGVIVLLDRRVGRRQ